MVEYKTSPPFLRTLAKKLNEGARLSPREQAYVDKNDLIPKSGLNESRAKYSFVSDKLTGPRVFFYNGLSLYRIVAEQSFDATMYQYRYDDKHDCIEKRKINGTGKVVKGTLGGYVDSMSCLSQSGASWIHGTDDVKRSAVVCKGANVSGNAQLFGSAKLFGKVTVADSSIIGDDVKIDGTDKGAEIAVSGYSRLFAGVQITGKVSLDSCLFFGKIRLLAAPDGVLLGESVIEQDEYGASYFTEKKDKMRYYEKTTSIPVLDAILAEDALGQQKIYPRFCDFEKEIVLAGVQLFHGNSRSLVFGSTEDVEKWGRCERSEIGLFR